MAGTTVGTRLKCEQCGTEIIVVKASDGDVVCCGNAMAEKGS